MTHTLHIDLLGRFRLLYNGTPVLGITSTRLQSLVAHLVLHRQAPQPRQYLAFLLWPDSSETQAHTNLRNLLHRLRSVLPSIDEFIHADAHTLQWRPDVAYTSDVAEFERAATQVIGPRALQEAVSLYAGDLLPSCYDDWIQPHRELFRQMFIGVLQRLILLLEYERDYQAAASYAQRLLHQDPLREETYRQLMRLHALSGDRAAALRAYHTCATVMQRELGVAPSRATREAYELLLNLENGVPPIPSQLIAVPPLIGRDREWATLQAAWRQTAPGRPHLALLTGEPGIGKTRLAEELTEWAGAQGIATASTHCYAAAQDLAYAAVVGWLRARRLPPLDETWLSEVARLLPELLVERPGLAAPDCITESGQRLHFFEALVQALLAASSWTVLRIEDVQWCDLQTLEWLPYLLQRRRASPESAAAHSRLLVVCTSCSEVTGPGAAAAERAVRLEALLADLSRSGQLTTIQPEPLNPEETLRLAGSLAGEVLDRALAAPLHQATEGNPLLIVETVRAAQPRSGRLTAEQGQGMATWPLAPKVRQVFESRLKQLSPPAHELMSLAATIGREFTFAVLARASGMDEAELVQGLDELWRRRIVREQGLDAYSFSHDKLREVAYGQLSAARRRLLHRRVAEALEALHGDDLDSVSASLAAHYEQAGLIDRALTYYLRAAEAAGRMFAHQDAIILYQRGLALTEGAPVNRRRGDVTAQLERGLSDALELSRRRTEEV